MMKLFSSVVIVKMYLKIIGEVSYKCEGTVNGGGIKEANAI